MLMISLYYKHSFNVYFSSKEAKILEADGLMLSLIAFRSPSDAPAVLNEEPSDKQPVGLPSCQHQQH
jgi:hypothetical protein